MLSALRRSKRLLAPIALAIAAMVVLGSADWWHADDEDASQPAFHDHAAHHYVFHATKASATPAPEHCYLCHWLRTLGSGVQTASLHGLTQAEARRLPAITHRATAELVAALLPARAPPV